MLLSEQVVSCCAWWKGGPCTQFFLEDPDGYQLKGWCCAAEGPGMFQYISPVASVTPASIQLRQRLGNLQNSVYLAWSCFFHDSLIASHKLVPSPSPTQLHPILWSTGVCLECQSQGLDLNPVNFGYIHQILIFSPNRLEILGSLNQWWVCVPQNAHEAYATWGDTNIKAPGRKQYTQDAIGRVPWPKAQKNTTSTYWECPIG